MKISIITACYNSEQFLENCIQSVLSQKHQDIEHIIVDGGSTDNTLNIIKKYSNHLKYVSEPDKGIYDAMNKGIAMATGDIIGILNSDDFYYNDNIASLINDTFEQHNCDACYGDLLIVDANNIKKVKRTWISGLMPNEKMKSGWHPPHPTLYLTKKCYERIGKYKLNYKISADYDMMIRLLEKSNSVRMQYINEFMVVMRNGGASTKNLKSKLTIARENQRAWIENGLTPPHFLYFRILLKKIRQLV